MNCVLHCVSGRLQGVIMEQSDPEQTPREKPVVNFSGEKVALGPTHKGMIPFFARWENDFSVSVMGGDPLFPRTREAIEADYDRFTQEGQSGHAKSGPY